MEWLCREFQTDAVEIVLRNHTWVDTMECRNDGKQIPVMLPEPEIEGFIERHSELRCLPTSAFYLHEYRCIDQDFPYPDLTLVEIGIPDWDVLHVRTTLNEYYVELAPWSMKRT